MPDGRPQTFGPYRIAGVLGRGAMGVVYRAVDERSGRPAAVKTVAEELLAGPEADEVVGRFRREADIGRRLDHPGIVRVFEHGEEAGLLYLAMELIDGRDFKALTEAAAPPPPARAVRLGVQLLDALGHAHGQGVVHRDIKPANVFLCPEERVKLMDFGIAHTADSELTRTGEMVGSPSFMAPEQVRGEAIDARADLFAAGALLYVLLAGRRPFQGNVAAVLHQVLTRDPPPASQANPACPPALDTVLARALAKDPTARWQDAAAFSAALQAALAGVDEADADATVMTIVPAIRRHEPPTGLGREDAGLDDADSSLAELLRECLADGVTEKRLAAAAALVEIFGASPDGAERLRRAAEPAMAELADRILTGYPAPGGEGPPPRPDWRAAVRLFALLQAGSAGGFPETTARIAGQLVAACYDYSPRLNALLFTEAEPDVARISMDLLRLDLVQLALEDLDTAADARKARQALRGFSGQVLAKANALIGAYLASRDALARFSVANLLVSVEDLIGIAERLFEYGEDETADAADAVGQAVIADFAEKAAGLVELVAEEAMAELADAAAPSAGFANRLDQVGFIYLFATRLRHPHCRDAMAGLVRRAQETLRRLGDAASAALTDALAVPRERLAEAGPESARVRAAFGRIGALIALAERLGWADLRSRLMTDLRARLTADPAIARLAAGDA